MEWKTGSVDEWVVIEEGVFLRKRDVIGVYKEPGPDPEVRGEATRWHEPGPERPPMSERPVHVALSGGQTIRLATTDLESVLSKIGLHVVRVKRERKQEE